MNEKQLFILIAILSLVIIGGLYIYVIRARKDETPLTPLTGLAFSCIVAGIIFGEARWLGYGLIGLGVILAVVDMINKLKKAK